MANGTLLPPPVPGPGFTPPVTMSPLLQPVQPVQPTAAQAPPPAPALPAASIVAPRQLPEPRWFWYTLSFLSFVVGIGLGAVYLTRRGRESKMFGLKNLLAALGFAAVVTAIILYKYFVVDPPAR